MHAILAGALCAALLTLAGCGREDAAETREDIAAAETEAATQVAEAREEAAGATSDAQHEAAEAIVDADGRPVPDARQELRSASSAGAYEVAVAQAEGAHKVAVERCDALSGDRRQNCRDRADAELQQAKTRAQQARDGRS